MYFLIPLIIIVVALVAIIYVVARKFPQLSNLDVENLPEEIEARKKNMLLSQRIEEQGRAMWGRWKKRLGPVFRLWAILQLRFRVYVGRVERLWYHEQTIKSKAKGKEMTREEKAQKLESLIQSAEHNLKLGHYDKAEELFIEAIKINVRAAPAYRGLADAYLAKGALDEAQQTYRFLLHLEPEDDATMVKLADIAESLGNLEEAINYYQSAVLVNDSISLRFYHLGELLIKVKQPETALEAIIQATELEPKNPKFLDLLIETAIICGNKDMAIQGYNELRSVNPSNQKLDEFRDRITQM